MSGPRRLIAYVGIVLVLPCVLMWSSRAQAQPLAQAPHVNLGALTLSEADQLLRTRNRELTLAQRNIDLARADTLAAGSHPNPTLTVGTGGINTQAGIGSGRPWEKTVDSFARIDQLIERGGKRGYRIDVAKNLETATESEVADILRQQRLILGATYYDLMLAQDKVSVATDTIALYEKSIDAAEQRLKAGDVAQADVTRIRVDALRGQNDARSAEAERTRAQVALAYLIGAEAAAQRIRAVDEWPALDAYVQADLDALIERRPDVRAAQARVAAAQSGRELARSLRTRDISVGGQFDRYPVSAANQNGSGNTFGVSVSVPLFLRYQFEGEIARAEASFSAALESVERVRALARSELSQSSLALQAAADRLRRFDQSLLVEAKRSAEFAEFAYKNGAIGVMDLLDARRVLRATQFDAVQARADYAKSLATWRAGLDAGK